VRWVGGGVEEGRLVVAPAASLRPSAERNPPIRMKPRMDGAPGSSFASGGWYAATGEYLSPGSGGVLSTPTNLGNAIRNANGGQNMGVMTHPVSAPPLLQGDIP
jgi:hypothetical protein